MDVIKVLINLILFNNGQKWLKIIRENKTLCSFSEPNLKTVISEYFWFRVTYNLWRCYHIRNTSPWISLDIIKKKTRLVRTALPWETSIFKIFFQVRCKKKLLIIILLLPVDQNMNTYSQQSCHNPARRTVSVLCVYLQVSLQRQWRNWEKPLKQRPLVVKTLQLVQPKFNSFN